MATPTCRTCDTKFPGKDVCKTCGADPRAEPTLDYKIERAKAKPKVHVITDLKVHSVGPVFHPVKRLSVRDIARVFEVPTRLIVDQETLRKERARHRAHLRSLQNTRTSGRKYKHGRVGVR